MRNLTGMKRWLAVMVMVLGVQLAPVSAFAATPENHPVPSAKNLPQALAIIEQTSRNSDVSLGKPDPSFSGRLKQFKRKYSPDPKLTFKVERTERNPSLVSKAKKRNDFKNGRNADGIEQGTFYDRKGRLRKWVRDPAAPGGVRVLESPPMELLRKLTGGFIDWGFEQDYVGIDLEDLPKIPKKPVQEQTYLERKNAKKRFVTKMGLSLSMPHPIEVGKLYYLRGKFVGEGVTLVKVSRWVDGDFAGDEEIYGKNFSIPLKFSESGNHSLKVETIDTEGAKRTRFIQFPVAFTMAVKFKSSTTDGGQTRFLVRMKGSKGPFKATFITSDGQKFEKNDDRQVIQRVPNPGQNSVKWVDIVMQDMKAGYVVSRRIKLDDIPVEARLSAAKTDLAPDEKTRLVVDIKGGEPLFTMFLYENGKKTQVRAAKGRKGNFIVSFDEPGTYRMTVSIVSKNIAGEKVTSTTRPVVLTVGEPEEEFAPPLESGTFAGGFDGLQINLAKGAKIKNGQMRFSISDGVVTGNVKGQLIFSNIVNNFTGDVTGSYDVTKERITAKIKGRWSGAGGGGLILGTVSGMGNTTGFAGRWKSENMSGVWSADPID